MAATTSEFLYYQLLPLPSVSSFARSLTGRTVLLTGGNTGLGLECAKHLASLGPDWLIITSRSASNGAAAVKEILAAGAGKVGKVECWEIDQAKFSSVRALCDRFAREGGGKLDLLVLNAGLVQPRYTETEDGWELMLQVNHLSTALLAIRLLPFLLAAKAAPPTPRVVIVNSGLHHRLQDVPEAEAEGGMLRLLCSKEYSQKAGKMMVRYPLTKLFNIFFTRALASRLPTTSPLSINSVNPGLCHSQLARGLRRTWFFWAYTTLLGRSSEAGSRTLVHAAVGKDLDGRTGEYVESCRVSLASTLVRSERGKEIQDKLWAATIEQLTLADPEVPRIVKQYLS